MTTSRLLSRHPPYSARQRRHECLHTSHTLLTRAHTGTAAAIISTHTMSCAHCRMITRLSQRASHWWAMCLLILLAVQESSAASHKCHFRVRCFDRVLTFPYKSVLMVDRALKIRCAGSDPPGPSANASSLNGTHVRDLNMQIHATVVRHRVARGACFERAMFDSRTRRSP